MTTAADPSDAAAYAMYGERLRDAIDVAFRPWLEAVLRQRCRTEVIAPELEAAMLEVERDARARIEELIHADVDAALSGPLERLRQATEALSPVLTDLAVPAPARDPFDQKHRPNDRYALGPFAFADLGPDVQEAGMAWGAAKAFIHRARRQ